MTKTNDQKIMIRITVSLQNLLPHHHITLSLTTPKIIDPFATKLYNYAIKP